MGISQSLAWMQSLSKTVVVQNLQMRQGRVPLRLETHSAGYQWLDGQESKAQCGTTSSAPVAAAAVGAWISHVRSSTVAA